MALYGRDYGYYGNTRDYDMGYRGNRYAAYDRNYGYATDTGYYGAAGYDRENYKSRWQTDYGDPFGDRTARTPMRMIRGEFHGAYDRDMRMAGAYDRNYGMTAGYDRAYYAANPASYDPYANRAYEGRRGTWNRYDNNYQTYGYGRRYDTGWF